MGFLSEAEIYGNDQPPPTPAEQIAIAFIKVIQKWLTPAELDAVRWRNMSYPPGTCATHDFCDANMAMAEAFEIVTGIGAYDIDPANAETAALWSAAWDIAVRRKFSLDQFVTTMHDVFTDFPLADLPPIPDGWVDISWRNDAAPRFQAYSEDDGATTVTVMIDYLDQSERECPGPRFNVQFEHWQGSEASHYNADFDDWLDVLRTVGNIIDALTRGA